MGLRRQETITISNLDEVMKEITVSNHEHNHLDVLCSKGLILLKDRIAQKSLNVESFRIYLRVEDAQGTTIETSISETLSGVDGYICVDTKCEE